MQYLTDVGFWLSVVKVTLSNDSKIDFCLYLGNETSHEDGTFDIVNGVAYGIDRIAAQKIVDCFFRI